MRVGLEEQWPQPLSRPGVMLRRVRMESLEEWGWNREGLQTNMDWQGNFLKEKEQEGIRAQFQFIWLGS